MCNEHGLDKVAYKRSYKNEYDILYIDKLRKIAKMIFYGELKYMG